MNINRTASLPRILLSPVTTLLFLLFSAGVSAQLVSEQQAAGETEIPDLRLLEPAYGISFAFVENDTKPGSGRYLCGGMTANTARSAAALVRSAFAKLPASGLAKAQLKYVILCSRAEASGQAIGGIPVPPLNLLMLGISANNNMAGELLVIHELYHLLEYRFNTFSDADWQSHFPAGYANSYSARVNQVTIGSGKAGFLNSYSETFPHEDRAELFAALLLNAPKVTAQINSANDATLREKVLYLANKWNPLLGTALPYPR